MDERNWKKKIKKILRNLTIACDVIIIVIGARIARITNNIVVAIVVVVEGHANHNIVTRSEYFFSLLMFLGLLLFSSFQLLSALLFFALLISLFSLLSLRINFIIFQYDFDVLLRWEIRVGYNLT